MPCTITKYPLKMDHRSKCKSGITNVLEGNIGENICDFSLSKDFLGKTPNACSIKKTMVS